MIPRTPPACPRQDTGDLSGSDRIGSPLRLLQSPIPTTPGVQWNGFAVPWTTGSCSCPRTAPTHTVDDSKTESFEVPSRSGDAKRCTAIASNGSNDLPFFFGQGSAAHLTCSCRWASAEAHSRRRIATPLKDFKLPRR